MNTYQYKVVLVCACAGMFRGKDLQETKKSIAEYDVAAPKNKWIWGAARTQADLDYASELVKVLEKLEDYTVRIENPWLSVYSNSSKDLYKIVKIKKEAVKYFCVPPEGGINADTIILPKIDFEFKVTLSKTTRPCTDFIEWADKSPKVKLTKRCIRDLSLDNSWGGSHFYITGEKNLLLAKMQLGGCISKIERIVKA